MNNDYIKQNNDAQKKINLYANKCGDSIEKLFSLIKFILKKEETDTQELLDNASAYLSNTNNNSSLSGVFLASILPFYDYLKRCFYKNESDDEYLEWQVPTSIMYSIIQNAIVVFTKNLAELDSNICISIKEKTKNIDDFYTNYGISNINKSIMLINKNCKLNTFKETSDLKSESTERTQIDLIDAYSVFLTKKLHDHSYNRGLAQFESVAAAMIANIKNFNNFNRNEMSIINPKEIPNEYATFLIINQKSDNNFDIGEDDIISNIFNNNSVCNVLAGRGSGLKEINFVCNTDINKVLNELNQEIITLLNKNRCTSEININKNEFNSKIDDRLSKLVDKLNKVSNLAETLITNNDIEMETEFENKLEKIRSNISTDDEDFTNHMKYMPLISSQIKSLEFHIKKIESKIKIDQSLEIQCARFLSIDKSILKLMCEQIMAKNIFIHSFLKFNWVNLLFRCTESDIFSDFNVQLGKLINSNYLLVIGSINNKTTAEFLYNETANLKFFNNTEFKNKIISEYYNGLKEGLGKFIKCILFEMLNVMSSLDITKDQLPSLDYSIKNDLNETLIAGNSRINDNYAPCFCTINYLNKPVNLIHNSIDYFISYICINYKMNNLNSKAKELFDLLIDLLSKEPYSELTSCVYSRWVAWICLFFGKIESISWEAKIIVSLKLSDLKLADIARRHLNANYQSNNTYCVKLADNKTSFETKIDQAKLDAYINDPKSFPDKNEFTIKTLTSNINFKPNFDVSSIEKEIETKLILLNKFGKLGCSTIYNYENYKFTAIDIDNSNELLFIFK
jgi:hypothetical protein